jgi:hypothetical protein
VLVRLVLVVLELHLLLVLVQLVQLLATSYFDLKK